MNPGMVDKLARAFNDDIERGLPHFVKVKWEDLYPHTQDALRSRVRAVLRALSEPDEGMLEAGRRVLGREGAYTVFTAMIDHILEQEDQP